MDKPSLNLKSFFNRYSKNQLIAAGVIGATSITGLVLGKKYFNGGVCHIVKDLSGYVIVITGSNTGIGKETVKALASMNATVILACRDPLKSLGVVDEIRKETKNQRIEFMQLDLADLHSIKAFAEEFKSRYQKLNILINNAGVMAVQKRTLTKDGFEIQFGTNHLGHFYLTKLLLDVIKNSAPSRIINVSSGRHLYGKMRWDDIMFEKKYSPFEAYDQSKLANVIFTKELQRRLDEEGANVKVVSLHPGVVRTELKRHVAERLSVKLAAIVVAPVWYYITKSTEQGAQTTLYCALEDHNSLHGGSYYKDCKLSHVNPEAVIEENGKRLWDLSEKLISETLKEPVWL